MSKTPHAIVRAKERYDLDLTTDDIDEIARRIKQDGVLVATQSDGGKVWLTTVKKKLVRVVLSKNGFVRTFLDLNAKINKARMG